MAKRVGVVGVGAMGKLMAAQLLQKGYTVTVCPHKNRQPVEELAAQGAQVAENPAGVAAASEVVVTMVPDAPQVEEVCFGEGGLLAGKQADQPLTLIDMSTISPIATTAIAKRLAEHGVGMLDAPVSGGPARAATGELTIMVGGEPALFEEHHDVLAAMGKNITLVGPVGHGEIAKLTNNLIIGVLMPALGEALTFAVKAGADLEKVREIVMTATGGNYLLANWLPQYMLQDKYDGGFALELMHKDLGAALSAARDLNVPMPAAGLAYQLFAQAKGLGYGREDYSAVSKITQDAANITIATGAPRRS